MAAAGAAGKSNLRSAGLTPANRGVAELTASLLTNSEQVGIGGGGGAAAFRSCDLLLVLFIFDSHQKRGDWGGFFGAFKTGAHGGEMRRAWRPLTEARSGANGPLTGKESFDVHGRGENRKNIRRAAEVSSEGQQRHKTSRSSMPRTPRSASR